MDCANCDDKECYQGKDCTKIKEKIISAYNEDSRMLEMARMGTYLEGNYYMQLTRLEELIVFAKKMDFKKVGIAFCIGLSAEVKTLDAIMSEYFKTYSACCKVCGINKEIFGFDKIDGSRFEAMCNPAGQAAVLNNVGTDLNIIFGLCIGHDIIFSKNSDAPVTTLLVKDRVLAHNPCGSIYSGYYRKRIGSRIEKITGVKQND